MRRLIRAIAKMNWLFRILDIFFELGHIICVFMPVSLLPLSPVLRFVIAAIIYFLDRPVPGIAWLAHLVLWCVSIIFISSCQVSLLVTIYVICAIAYVLVEIVCTGIIVVAAAKNNK